MLREVEGCREERRVGGSPALTQLSGLAGPASRPAVSQSIEAQMQAEEPALQSR